MNLVLCLKPHSTLISIITTIFLQPRSFGHLELVSDNFTEPSNSAISYKINSHDYDAQPMVIGLLIGDARAMINNK
jgi:hypothetical protein